MNYFFLHIITGLLCLVVVGTPAWGGTCLAVAEAFKKADKQDRIGTRLEAGGLLEGHVREGERRIGKVKCIPSTDIVVAYSCEDAKDPGLLSSVGKGKAQLYTAGEKSGEFECRAVGIEKVDGEVVNKYELVTKLDGEVFLTEFLWVSPQTGLPIAHRDGGGTFIKYFYGSAVKDCNCQNK